MPPTEHSSFGGIRGCISSDNADLPVKLTYMRNENKSIIVDWQICIQNLDETYKLIQCPLLSGKATTVFLCVCCGSFGGLHLPVGTMRMLRPIFLEASAATERKVTGSCRYQHVGCKCFPCSTIEDFH